MTEEQRERLEAHLATWRELAGRGEHGRDLARAWLFGAEVALCTLGEYDAAARVIAQAQEWAAPPLPPVTSAGGKA